MNRINEYLTDEDAYKGWVNTVVLIFHFNYGRPIDFTPLIRQNLRKMFLNEIEPSAASQWIMDVYRHEANYS